LEREANNISFDSGNDAASGHGDYDGTLSGVGYFQKRYLKEGDVVEVEIEGFEKLRNVVKFE
jgi:hypothetical protein